MIDTKHIKQVVFDNCVIHRMTWGWGLFTPTPIHDQSYVWFIKSVDEHSALLIPRWLPCFAKEIQETGFYNCVTLANAYEKFYERSIY